MPTHLTESVHIRRYRLAVHKARAHTRALAARWGVTEELDALELAVSEAVTNAVTHGDAPKGSRVTITYRLTGTSLRIEVRDRATGTPEISRRDPGEDELAENGRGLRMLAAVTDRWGVIPHVIGKSVWFEIDRAAAPAPANRARGRGRGNGRGRPTVYGYMRVREDAPDETVREDEERMRHWADAEGYDLAVIYQELEEGSLDRLNALVAELVLTRARCLVVPSFEHLGVGRVLQDHVWAHVAERSGAEIHEAREGGK